MNSIVFSEENLNISSTKNIKFALQRTAAELITEYERQKFFDKRTFQRISSCNSRPISRINSVSVRRHFRKNSSYYAGIQVCGSVWQCPVCSARISERRRIEVQQALVGFLGENYGVPVSDGRNVRMITRTFPHSSHDSLEFLLKKFKIANEFYQKHKRYVSLPKKGVIRVLELTFGKNGWHIHTHELLFFEEYLTNQAITGIYMTDDIVPRRFCDSRGYEFSTEYGVFEIWRRACLKAGLGEPSPRAFDIRNGDYAAAYISKYGREPKESFWLASHEFTKFHIKRSSKLEKGMTPFDLLRSYYYFSYKEHGYRFVEFAESFKGMRQLHWSKGLKKHFGIGEKTDEELSCHSDESSVKLASLSMEKWNVIKRLRLRGELLDMFDVLPPQKVVNILNVLCYLPNTYDFCTEFCTFVQTINDSIQNMQDLTQTYEYVMNSLIQKYKIFQIEV